MLDAARRGRTVEVVEELAECIRHYNVRYGRSPLADF